MQRKSLYANRDIIKGEIIKDSMISIKGPGGGLLPKYKDMVVGRKAKLNIQKDNPIMWKSI
jgi:sialic acid synthase SpsE